MVVYNFKLIYYLCGMKLKNDELWKKILITERFYSYGGVITCEGIDHTGEYHKGTQKELIKHFKK